MDDQALWEAWFAISGENIQLQVIQGQEDSEECFWHIVQQIRLPLDHPQTATFGGDRRYPVLHLYT